MGKGTQMTYWTILWITALGGPFDGDTSFVVYPSMEACEAATDAVSDTLTYDHMMECEATGILSSSLRPKRNPNYTEN